MPLSEKRLSANRANALKSIGPKTEHGKQMSAQNGSRHTWLANTVRLTEESRDRFLALTKSFEDMFQPEDPLEQSLVENMVVSRWRTIRLWDLESANLNHAVERIRETGIQENTSTTAALAMQNLPDGGRTRENSAFTKPAMTANSIAPSNSSRAVVMKNVGQNADKNSRSTTNPIISRRINRNPNDAEPNTTQSKPNSWLRQPLQWLRESHTQSVSHNTEFRPARDEARQALRYTKY